jgi:hypothetical protein
MWFGLTLEKGKLENNFLLQETSSIKCRTYRMFLFVYREVKKSTKNSA